MSQHRGGGRPSRHDFLQLLGGGAAALALGDLGIARAAEYLLPRASSYDLTAAPFHADLGGSRRVSTIGFNHQLPGPLLRAREGERLQVNVTNHLKASTSVHWHGIPLVNKMDGVPGLTQPPIVPGTSFQYDFKIPVSGTYWYHSHSSAQMDRAMYGPLILDAKREELSYDREVVLVLDDWRDGIGTRAARDLSNLYECQLGFTQPSQVRGQPPLEPASYPLHLVNGRGPQNPTQVRFKRGDVVRLRLINAGAATTYRVALAGHTMRVTHADGQPVSPVDVDTLEIGMAERYDVLIHAHHPGVWQFAAVPSSTGPIARAIFRYEGHGGAAPPARYRPRQLKGKRLTYAALHSAGGFGHPKGGRPDLSMDVTLAASYGVFYLLFNGRPLDGSTPLRIPRNAHVRFAITNDSPQIHPMHLHGHFFQLNTRTGNGPMKDTAIIAPSQTYTIDWVANNPGLWMFHCHNLYHMLNGLMHTFDVR